MTSGPRAKTHVLTDAQPVTRLWVALQRLGRLRDEYTRDKCPARRLAAARAMVDRAAELRALAAEVLAEAEGEAA